MQWVAGGLFLVSLPDFSNEQEFMENYNAIETITWICEY